ncbi:hypothetical protein SUGI_0502320 [Cryptomeria japonica]|uniref:BTB/POZ domain-containing protein At5g48800 n=1 Tax=Cryptomeria japonica TaxID=3369 RepID=UPI002408D212|nr:BTB/POZ domain-containing protein At5g48800 [Cryptomeria japonica]GLJ26184.1 hypothetical protein SUGI_0502320 [Cryptomeria japonica]
MAGNGKGEKPLVLLKRSITPGKQGSKWIFSDVPSDIVVVVDGGAFALHKFPLVSRSGRIRKIIADGRDSDVSKLQFPNLPGGAEAFELAAKFCYGINFEITTSNVAALRCVAEYLQMTEDYADENLVARTEVYLNEVVIQSLEKSVEVLHSCENLLPLAEEVKILSRCVDGIASKACREQMASSLSRLDYSSSGRLQSSCQQNCSGDWWVEDLSVLRIDMYQKVMLAMRSKGVRHESIGASLMHYAQHSLKGLSKKQLGWDASNLSKAAAAMEHEQRILVETIVSLLPVDMNTMPITFLFGLLRTAVMLDTTVACRLDLERRIGLQLEMATLDDLLIPSFSHTGDTLFDVDTVHRILVNFLQQDENQDPVDSHLGYESDGLGDSPSQTAIIKVAKVIDSYLAEIAPDANLKLSKFMAIIELLPDYARVVDDGLYRAIDIYLKAHSGLTEIERKKLCKLIDCQKLSQEACAHAAQNERLPVHLVVQVLYFEQLRLRNSLAGSYADGEPPMVYTSQRINSGAPSAAMSPRDNYASLRRENRELKLEIARMRMRLTDLEKEQVCMKEGMVKSKSSTKLLSSLSKKFGKLNFFNINTKGQDSPSKKSQTSDSKKSRRRRHSIS